MIMVIIPFLVDQASNMLPSSSASPSLLHEHELNEHHDPDHDHDHHLNNIDGFPRGIKEFKFNVCVGQLQ